MSKRIKVTAEMLRRYTVCAKRHSNLHDKTARQKMLDALIADGFTPQEIIAIEYHIYDVAQGC